MFPHLLRVVGNSISNAKDSFCQSVQTALHIRATESGSLARPAAKTAKNRPHARAVLGALRTGNEKVQNSY
jgi:hypothetical protein